jgi:alcohol dehydrogenase (cytochrome c)
MSGAFALRLRHLLCLALVATPALAQTANDWPAFNRTLRGDRFAPQREITPANVGQLHEVCHYDLGMTISNQTGPVEVGGVLYLTTGHDTIALDASTCAEKWRVHETYKNAGPLDVNRGAAVLDGRVFRGTQDARVLAYDAASGKRLWEATLGDATHGETIPAAVLAWNGLVFAGNAGSEADPTKGRMYALDAATGRIVWEQYLLPRGENDKPRGPSAPAPKSSGSTSLTGGTSWTAYSLDPATGTLYIPGGDPEVSGSELRSNVVALDARSGAVRKTFPLVKEDFHDWEISAAPALYEAAGHLRFAAMSKDGILYSAEATTGARAWQAPTTTVENASAPLNDAPVHFCPGTQGGNEWNGAAYSPDTKLLYAGSVDWCTTVTRVPGKEDPKITMDPPATAKGWLTAIDAKTGRKAWQVGVPSPVLAGVTPTAGGLLFAGDLSGTLYALDAKSGSILVKQPGEGSMAGGIISYALPSGEQRIAVMRGNKSILWPMAKGSAQIVVYGLAKR